MNEIKYVDYLWTIAYWYDYRSYKGSQGVLNDILKCEITIEKTGKLLCEVEYPENGVLADRIKLFRYLVCPIYSRYKSINKTAPFVITRIERNNGIMHITAVHVISLIMSEYYLSHTTINSIDDFIQDYGSRTNIWVRNLEKYMKLLILLQEINTLVFLLS